MKKIALYFTILILSTSAFAERISNPNDPYEGYNRFMFSVNDKANRVVFKPVVKGYRFITPKPARTAIGNFFDNLRDITSIASNILRADLEKTSSDVMRVGLNSTFGLFGLIDIATPAGLPNHKNTLGDTFASWGWKNSNYFVYPLLGPSTVRDATGTTIGFVLDPEKLVFTETRDINLARGLNSISSFDRYIDLYDSLNQASLDPYAYMRDAFMDIRMRQVGGKWPLVESENSEEINIDDLVSPESTGFNTNPESAPVVPEKNHSSISDAHQNQPLNVEYSEEEPQPLFMESPALVIN